MDYPVLRKYVPRDLPALVVRPTDEANLVADGYTLVPDTPPGGPVVYERVDDVTGVVSYATLFRYDGPWTFPG